MCVIIACLEKTVPSWDILDKCNTKNGDGCSITWFNEKNLAEYRKGLDLKQLYKLIQKIPLPYILHFRLASKGIPISPLLTHPFEVNEVSPLRLHGEAEKLLIHNGTINEYEWLLVGAGYDIDKSELMSDTRAIAKVIARNDNEKLLNKLAGNFILADSINKKFRMYGTWITEDGLQFSNTAWKYYSKAYTFDSQDDDWKWNGHNFQKSYCSSTPTEDLKKTQEIITSEKKEIKKNTLDIVKINKDMTELQYNSSIYFRFADKNNPAGNKSEYMKEGLKERRKWWRFFYNENTWWNQRIDRKYPYINKNDKDDEIGLRCCQCKDIITLARVNTLTILGARKSEWTCSKCASKSDRENLYPYDSKRSRLALPFHI